MPNFASEAGVFGFPSGTGPERLAIVMNAGIGVVSKVQEELDAPQPCRHFGFDYSNPEMATNLDPDAALMLRVKRGDVPAFEELVGKYKQPVMNVVQRMLRDPTEAEDLAQNVFVQVYKASARYKASAKFSTWLFTIARNLCLNELRRRSRHPADSLEASQDESEDRPVRQYEDVKTFSPTDHLLHSELEQKVEQALRDLPENQRTAILLCRRDELSYDDISEVLGCSLSATKSLIHRGRETLKEKLKPYLRTGAWKDAEK